MICRNCNIDYPSQFYFINQDPINICIKCAKEGNVSDKILNDIQKDIENRRTKILEIDHLLNKSKLLTLNKKQYLFFKLFPIILLLILFILIQICLYLYLSQYPDSILLNKPYLLKVSFIKSIFSSIPLIIACLFYLVTKYYISVNSILELISSPFTEFYMQISKKLPKFNLEQSGLLKLKKYLKRYQIARNIKIDDNEFFFFGAGLFNINPFIKPSILKTTNIKIVNLNNISIHLSLKELNRYKETQHINTLVKNFEIFFNVLYIKALEEDEEFFINIKTNRKNKIITALLEMQS
jgi:hypothetical protein